MKTLHSFRLWANTRVCPYIIYLLLFIFHSSFFTFCEAQNVAINSTGNQADPSAMLDVASTSAGVLIPRMTTAQRSAISSPAIGLQIYNTDCGELNYWNGTCWLSSSASLPAPYPITGVTTACVGATGITYSVPGVIGATGYNWSVPGGAIITSGQSTTAITVSFGSSAGTVCVTANDACETSPQACVTVNISVGPPTPGNIAGLTSVCTNSTAVTYSVAPVFGATSYTWTLPTGTTGSSNTNSITVNFTGASAGNATLCVAANNSCGAGSSSCLTVAISPLPSAAGTISGSSSVCVNQSNVSYSVPSIANSNASGYTWAYSGSGATISGSGNSVTLNFSSAATSGNLTVMGTNSCGNGTVSANYPITVNPVPVAAGTITGTATVCQGARAVSFSVTSITGATSYTWSYSGSGDTLSGTTNPVTINFSSAATAGSLTVAGTNSCGNGTASTAYPIAVNQLPGGTGTISGTSVVCQNQTGVAYSVSGISGATSYTWGYTGTGATITGTTNSVTVSFSGSATAGNITVSGTNSCGSGTQATFAVAISPPSLSTPGSINGNATVCTGGLGSYFVGPVTGATSYTWTYTGSGVTISSTTNQIDISFSNAATSGNLSVTANNACGASASSASFPVTVNTTPNSAFTSSPSPALPGESVIFTPADNTNQLYFWSFPGSVFSSAQNPSVTLGSSLGNIVLTVTKNGCNSTTVYSQPTGITAFSYTGAVQTFVVPSGVTTITVKMWGAGGGGGSVGGWSYGFPGGGGGYSTATFTVTPNETFTVVVGQGGVNGSYGSMYSEYGGGGPYCPGGSDCRYGAGGGGRSALVLSGNDVITAGGGGGGGSSRATNGEQGGAGGGTTGQNGTSYTTACAGQGATQSAGGAAGSGSGNNGSAGTQYQGGAGAPQSYGGGGGGGYYGGGGGAYQESNDMGGGGGGSGFVPAGGTTTTGSGTTPANSSDPNRGTAGNGGAIGVNGNPGVVLITY